MTDPQPETQTILAELRPSPPRRVVGVVILAVLGAVLIWLALAYPPAAFGWTVFLLGFGAACLWLAVRMWQVTGQGLVLTRDILRDHDGAVLARVDQIRAVNRGVFAFKPAGGFTLALSQAGPRGWAPGLWWRLGRSVGVGGVTHRHEARYMAEVLDQLIKTRT
ncbi:MAG: hypothetical protein U0934_10730 [Pseudotabrizicola sp.]|uniref:hypothetical protein n=1 Tax=Pseudotabrizicola sp. TaxID=2939647 RepID=UPI002731986E|nr:hypothetical protein [Pseudotabrizicola sp.]MDP2082884.1 hypothetical protein [Pseudotabrizicola sp.]MDZ7574416.1 hypothetical protein [Pseudotabrizicola sp.]